MSLRKSFIEIGWKIDKSGLTTANQETTKMIKKWESALGSIDAYNKRIKQLEAQQGKLTTQVDKTLKRKKIRLIRSRRRLTKWNGVLKLPNASKLLPNGTHKPFKSQRPTCNHWVTLCRVWDDRLRHCR